MDNQPSSKNQSSAAEESARLRRQIEAGARAAETINTSERPSTLNPGKVRRVTRTLNDDFAYLNKGAADRYAPTNEQYTAGVGPYAEKMVQQPNQPQQNPVKPKTLPYDDTNSYQQKRSRYYRQVARDDLAGTVLPSSLSLAKTTVSRTKASAVNIAALSWGIPIWLFVQLPFALISLICLGVVAGIETVTADSGGFIGWVTSQVATAVDTVLKLIGVDLANIALGLFGASYIITLATGLVTILILGFQYKLGLLNPIFGTGSTLKITALIIAIVGLGLPVLNLIPFVILWMVAVWFFPR